MPVVVVDAITRPEHVVEYLAQLLDQSGLVNSVLKYDDKLVGQYPAVQLLAMPFAKQFHGTHTWMVTLRVDIYVMHAKLTESRSVRHLEDLELATNIVSCIETNNGEGGLSLGQYLDSVTDQMTNRIIAGWVESETPGVMPPRSSKADYVVGTRLAWKGINEVRFT